MGSAYPERFPFINENKKMNTNKIEMLVRHLREVEVVFGNPVRKDCAGHGICRIQPFGCKESKNRCADCEAARAYLHIEPQKSIMFFYFFQESITRCAATRYFEKGVFRIDEPVLIHPVILDGFFDKKIRLLPGLYEVKRLEGCLCVGVCYEIIKKERQVKKHESIDIEPAHIPELLV